MKNEATRTIDTSNLEEFQRGLKEFLQELFPNVNIDRVVIKNHTGFYGDPMWDINVLVDKPLDMDTKLVISLVRRMRERFVDDTDDRFPLLSFMKPESYEELQRDPYAVN